ncbi:MAG: nitroreductase/quinone reductase family protein [Caldilineaceae bacterium]
MNAEIRQALAQDETIDITTIGRKSKRPQRTEIWFRRVDDRIYITGTPGPRDWYANLQANPVFTFHLKESIKADLPVRARFIDDLDERRRILSAPAMSWYHSQVTAVDDLVTGSPLIEVLFEEL